MQISETKKPISVTINQTAQISGLGRTTIYDLIKKGRLKTFCVGRRRLVVYSSLEELANGK